MKPPCTQRQGTKDFKLSGTMNISNKNPVLLLHIFSIKLKYFWNHTWWFIGENKILYYMGIEFQEKGSPHVHSFTWILHALNIQNEVSYIDFIEQTINAQFPHYLNGPELFELVETWKVYVYCRTCWKYTTSMNAASPMIDILLRRQLLQNHLILNLALMKSNGS